MATFERITNLAEGVSPIVMRTYLDDYTGCLSLTYGDGSADVKLLDPTVDELDEMIAHLTDVRMELWRRALNRGEEI